MATLTFSSSDTQIEQNPSLSEHGEIEVTAWLEAWMGQLRTGPYGDSIAYYDREGDCWVLNDGRRFTDWVVIVGD